MSERPAEMQAGRVGRAHGLDGSFYVTGAVARLLTVGASVAVGGREAEIVRRSGTDARPIVRLAGVGNRETAEAMRGMQMTVASAGAPQLGEDEWWAHELERCEVFDGQRRLGTVGRLIELPSCEALELQSDSAAGTLLVPLVKDAIRRVDIAARRIDVDGRFLDLAAGGPAAAERSVSAGDELPEGDDGD